MRVVTTSAIFVCALVLSTQALAAAPAPKAPVCTKLLPASVLNSLTGGGFVAATDFPTPIPASVCAWDGTATGSTNVSPADAAHHDLVLFFVVGAAQVARQWSIYTHPNKAFGPPTFPAGIGDKAVEANDYIAVVKGKTFFEMWAGNNGAHHLEYPQLEAVARYIAAHVGK